MSDYNKLFAEEKAKPSAWSIGHGTYAAFSFASEVFRRNEKEILKAAASHGFVKSDCTGMVRFTLKESK